MRNDLLALLLAALAALGAAGCAVHPGSARPATVEDLGREPGWLLLDRVPFVAQVEEADCGAAALSMVLAHWGVDAPAADLVQECAVPGEEGIRASALRDAAKRRGLSAYVIAGRLEDLEHELRRGRPVIVGLIRSLGPATVAHYEVVVGLRREGERVAALDPARGLVVDSLPAFCGEWAATRGVTLVVFRTAADAVAREPGGRPVAR